MSKDSDDHIIKHRAQKRRWSRELPHPVVEAQLLDHHFAVDRVSSPATLSGAMLDGDSPTVKRKPDDSYFNKRCFTA